MRAFGRLGTIAAMPRPLRRTLCALAVAGAAAAFSGCGGDGGPDPSIPKDQAGTLVSRIQEIQRNVDVGSCVVASTKTDDLISEIAALPSGVNDQVKQALNSAANNLKRLLLDPSKCEGNTTTAEPTTTEEPSTVEPTTTREATTTTRPTTTQAPPTTTTAPPTQTITPTAPGASGGIGPG